MNFPFDTLAFTGKNDELRLINNEIQQKIAGGKMPYYFALVRVPRTGMFVPHQFTQCTHDTNNVNQPS